MKINLFFIFMVQLHFRMDKLIANQDHRKRTWFIHFIDFTGERFRSSELS